MTKALKTLAIILLATTATACTNNHHTAPIEPEAPVLTPPTTEIAFGAFTYGGIWQGMQPIHKVEASIGHQLQIVHWFMSWDHNWDANLLEPLRGTGRAPLITWQSNNQSNQSIARGDHDEYIRTWAAGAREYGETIYLRPFPEMNGNWTNWNGDPHNLIQAWQRTVNIFKTEGATNVQWVWSPNTTDEPRTQANRMENYYPGSQYVDILALDGYNWGDTRQNIGWRTFTEVFNTGYDRITTLGNQPIWIAETGSAETGGNKAHWVNDMFTTTTTNFPRVEAIIWFDENKETDWRIDSSTETLAAFRNNLTTTLATNQ